MKMKQIELRFDKLYNRDRLAQPCCVSLPFSEGELFEENKVYLEQGDRLLPVQKKVLSRYKDGSVRFLFLRFLADIPANKGTSVMCRIDGGYALDKIEKVCDTGLFCRHKEQGYKISSGKLEFGVTDFSGNLFSGLNSYGKEYKGEQFNGPVLKLSDDCQIYNIQYGAWKLVEEGPVCVILSCRGMLVTGALDGQTEDGGGIFCETRVSAYAGKSYIDVEFRLINETDEELRMNSYEFAVKAGIEATEADTYIRTCVADSNYKTKFLTDEEGGAVEKSITAEFLMNQGNEHFAEVFYGTFFADRTDDEGGVCATVYQAHQNFPKAVAADKEGIVLKLIPEGSGPVCMQSGMAVSQQIRLYFHGADEELKEVNHQSILYQMPDRPVVEPIVYKMSGIYTDVFVDKDEQDFDVEAALIATGDNHTRSYGMMNWGDSPDANYTAQGRGKGSIVWTNNEYDFPHACMLQYVRTGIRRFLDYCIVAGTHQRDIDICHYSKDELKLGGQWAHTNGHSINGSVVCSHQWVEGLLDCYHATGDERFFEAAVGIGENVLKLLNTPGYQKTGGKSARETGWALRTLTALYSETHDERWTIKAECIIEQFKEWADMYDGCWLAPYIDNVAIRVPFMISVAVGSLMRYYREFPRTDIKTMIISAVDDLVDNCILDTGYFFYKELPSLARTDSNPLVLEALAIAYELTQDKRYLKAGRRLFDKSIRDSFGMTNKGKQIVGDAVLMGNAGTKRFAQMFIPVVTYYKALVENKMI